MNEFYGRRLRFRMPKRHGFGCSLGTVISHLPLPAFAVTNWSLALLQAGNSLGMMRGPWFPPPPPPLTPSSYFCGVQYSLLGTSYYRRDTQYSRPDFYRKYIAHQPQVPMPPYEKKNNVDFYILKQSLGFGAACTCFNLALLDADSGPDRSRS
jgi:hypothetical protein